jgi:hypothetical protein
VRHPSKPRPKTRIKSQLLKIEKLHGHNLENFQNTLFAFSRGEHPFCRVLFLTTFHAAWMLLDVAALRQVFGEGSV